jgi:hypothetical protein
VLRPSVAVLVVAVLLSGCGNRIKSKEKVQEAIINRLQTRSGLDVNSLDITTTSVTFDKNMAYATVAFHPKGDTSLNGGMTMKYTLESRDGKWAVINVGDSQGHSQNHGMAGSGSGASLPPGHPPVAASSDNGRPE